MVIVLIIKEIIGRIIEKVKEHGLALELVLKKFMLIIKCLVVSIFGQVKDSISVKIFTY